MSQVKVTSAEVAALAGVSQSAVKPSLHAWRISLGKNRAESSASRG